VSVGWIPRIGAEFAGYRLDSLIGHGGMSIVYRAEHLALGRTVAFKLLSPQLSEDESFRERFVRESRLAASLDHPNVIPIYEARDEDGVFFIAMRYVEGRDLKTALKTEGPLPPAVVASIIGQVASALNAAHEKGLVHRDVKPANILIASGQGVEESDHVYLSDFGVAKHSASKVLTKTGIFVGTADYASPEQIEGKPLDARADIYSLGCVLYESLAGAPVYDKDSEVALMYAHLLEPPPSLAAQRPELPPEIDEVVAKAMAKSPDDRYATAREVGAATRAALVGSGERAAATMLAPGEAMAGTVVAPAATATGGQPPQPPADTAEPAEPAEPAGAGTGGGRGGWDRNRKLLAAAAAVGLAVIAILGGLFLFGGDDDGGGGSATPTTPSGTLPGSEQPELGLATIVEPPQWKNCSLLQQPKPGALESAICPEPADPGTAFFPTRWEVSTYPDAAAMNKAYEAELAASGAKAGGRCDGTSWGGEGPWDHGPDKPGGKRFCYFAGNDAVIVWTHEKLGQPNHLDLLATARQSGSDHARLFNWWRFWHHRIGKAAS
jgi:serine/threonine-protein kinase